MPKASGLGWQSHYSRLSFFLKSLRGSADGPDMRRDNRRATADVLAHAEVLRCPSRSLVFFLLHVRYGAWTDGIDTESRSEERVGNGGGVGSGGCSACVICPETSHGHKREAACPPGFSEGERATPPHALSSPDSGFPSVDVTYLDKRHERIHERCIAPTSSYMVDTSGGIFYAWAASGASKAGLKAVFHSRSCRSQV